MNPPEDADSLLVGGDEDRIRPGGPLQDLLHRLIATVPAERGAYDRAGREVKRAEGVGEASLARSGRPRWTRR